MYTHACKGCADLHIHMRHYDIAALYASVLVKRVNLTCILYYYYYYYTCMHESIYIPGVVWFVG